MHTRLLGLLLLLFLLCVPPLHAQETRQVAPGQTIDGTVDAEHLSRMYLFTQGNAANEVAHLQNTGAPQLSLAVVDASGNRLAALPGVPGGSEARLSWPTIEGRTYYLLVFLADAPERGAGTFRLSLSGIAPTPAVTPTAEVQRLPASGALQFSLSWQAGARLSLEVRDPQGQSVHWRSPQSSDGGTFAGSTDEIDCASFTPHAQDQSVTWNAPLAGNYEILVHYVDGCETSIPFTIRVRMGSTDFPLLSGTLPSSDATFVAGFGVGSDGRAAISLRNGIVGANPTLNVATADLLANAQPLSDDGIGQGSISGSQFYRVFSFEAASGDAVSASASRTFGGLDTVLMLIDSNGNLIDTNDDANDLTTDSAISETSLRRGGTYLLVVTRYGQELGATEGDFTLTVTRTAS